MPEVCDNSMTLYGTQACHLCEQAAGLLSLAVQEALLSAYVEVDISEDETLFTRYGFRIPVLRRNDGAELDWPFSPAQLLNFIESGAQGNG